MPKGLPDSIVYTAVRRSIRNSKRRSKSAGFDLDYYALGLKIRELLGFAKNGKN